MKWRKLRYINKKVMTYISVKCPKCGCEKVSKNGKTSYGKQQYICNNINCPKSSFVLDFSHNVSKPEVKNKIIAMWLWYQRH